MNKNEVARRIKQLETILKKAPEGSPKFDLALDEIMLLQQTRISPRSIQSLNLNLGDKKPAKLGESPSKGTRSYYNRRVTDSR